MEMSVDPFSQASVIFYIIVFSAAMYLTFYQFLTRRFGNPDRVKEIQKEIQNINNRYKEAMKSKDDAKMKKAEGEQRRIPSLMMETMRYQFVPLIIVLPVIFVLPAFLRDRFPAFEIVLPFNILTPIPGSWSFIWRDLFGVYGFFFVSVFFISILAQAVMWVRGKLKKKDKSG